LKDIPLSISRLVDLPVLTGLEKNVICNKLSILEKIGVINIIDGNGSGLLIKPVFSSEQERSTIIGIFEKAVQSDEFKRYDAANIETIKNRVSAVLLTSSPLVGADVTTILSLKHILKAQESFNTPLKLRSQNNKLIRGNIEELNDLHLKLFHDWEYWRGFKKTLKYIDYSYIKAMLTPAFKKNGSRNQDKVFVVVTQFPGFLPLLRKNFTFLQGYKLFSGQRQIQGALKVTVNSYSVSLDRMETAPWNQFTEKQIAALVATGLIRFIYKKYLENSSRYLLLRTPIAPEAMNLYVKIFNRSALHDLKGGSIKVSAEAVGRFVR
jgi:hypothetical protein